MMKNAMIFEIPIPMSVSSLIRRNSSRACWGLAFNLSFCGDDLISSVSIDDCQKKRYGLIVVPSTATSIARYDADHCTCGTSVARNTCFHDIGVRNDVAT